MGQPLVAVPTMLYTLYPTLINTLLLYGFGGFFLSIFTFAIVATGVKSEKQGAPLLSELILLIKRLPSLFSLSILLFLLTLVSGLFFVVLLQLFVLTSGLGVISTVFSFIFAVLFIIFAFMYVIKLFVVVPAFVMNVDMKPQKVIRESLEFARGKYLHIFMLILAVLVIITITFNMLTFVIFTLSEPLLAVSLAVINGVLAWYMFLVPSYYYSENK